MELTKGIVRNAGTHKIFILLSGLFPDTIKVVQHAFAEILPSHRFLVFNAPKPVAALRPENTWRRRVAEVVREYVIDTISPDVMLLTSTVEGAVDDTITSIGELGSDVANAAIIYDLIPMIDSEVYLKSQDEKKWYQNKLSSLRQADRLLAISQTTADDAVRLLQLRPEMIANISAAASSIFTSLPHGISLDSCRRKFGITRDFLMHSSAFDPRKNFQGLLRAYARLPRHIRSQYQLVLVCKLDWKDRSDLSALADSLGITDNELVLTGFVTDEELRALYEASYVFIFPSLSEGFGLPPLEAMSCGTPTIGSNIPSVAEVIGRSDALFDATSTEDMTAVILRALTDRDFFLSLSKHAKMQSSKFSWDASAQRAIRSMEEIAGSRSPTARLADESKKRRRFFEAVGRISRDFSPTDLELLDLSRIINDNDAAIRRLRQLAGA